MRHDLDELEDLLVRYRPKLIYTNPTFQNPDRLDDAAALRRDLLPLATRLRVPIIEDDTYRELHFSAPPPPSLHSLDTQSVVIHLNSFSKVLAPGLRLGWLSAAQPIIEQLALHQAARRSAHAEPGSVRRRGPARRRHVRRASRRSCAPSTGAAATRWRPRSQRHGATGLLRWTMPDGGLYFWCRLGGRLKASSVLARALAESVSFVPGEAFYVDHAGERELRLCFSTVPPARADEVGRRLGRALAAARHETAPPSQFVAVV